MSDIEDVIENIQGAFAGNEHPGGRFLQGSFEGCEPYEEVGPFENEKDWKGIDAGFWTDMQTRSASSPRLASGSFFRRT